MKEMFNDVIEPNEEITEVLKPEYKTFMWARLLALLITFVFIALGVAAFIIGSFYDDELTPKGTIIGGSVIVFLYLLSVLLTYILSKISYKNTYYAYTNKRILIRSGIIGIDYKSLNYELITASIVNVSIIDKIIKRDTGSVAFGSPSSQLVSMSANSKFVNPFKFVHIKDPYNKLKEIRAAIDTLKSK